MGEPQKSLLFFQASFPQHIVDYHHSPYFIKMSVNTQQTGMTHQAEITKRKNKHINGSQPSIEH